MENIKQYFTKEARAERKAAKAVEDADVDATNNKQLLIIGAVVTTVIAAVAYTVTHSVKAVAEAFSEETPETE